MTHNNGHERSHSFSLLFCGDPDCGLHMLAKREDGSTICESVLSLEQTFEMAKVVHAFLHNRVALSATDNDDPPN